MIIFSQIITSKALFEYSAGFGPSIRGWRLWAILRPRRSLVQKRGRGSYQIQIGFE